MCQCLFGTRITFLLAAKIFVCGYELLGGKGDNDNKEMHLSDETKREDSLCALLDLRSRLGGGEQRLQAGMAMILRIADGLCERVARPDKDDHPLPAR